MKQIITFILLISSLCSYAQGDDVTAADTTGNSNRLLSANSSLSDFYTPKSLQIIPPSSQSAIFERYVDHPVQEYYGLPEITIPLYEIAIKGLKIPVTLSYYAGGVKYLQFDGDMGAGWSINAGGYKITRTVYGRSDFDYRNSNQRYNFNDLKNAQQQSVRSNFYMDRYLAHLYCETIYDDEGLGGVMSNSGGTPLIDGEFDQFTYMTPSTNGHFILTPTGVDIVEQHPDIITINKDAATLTDASGFQYLFGGHDTQTGFAYVEYSHYNDFQKNKTQETGWNLRQIISPYNETVKFKYALYRNRSDRTYGRYQSMTVTDASVYTLFGHPSEQKYSFATKIEKNKSTLNPVHNYEEVYYIQEIETDKEVITFHRINTSYGSDSDNTNTPCLLSDIEIKDKQTNLIKKISFMYKTSPGGVQTGNNDIPWHVLLTNVSIGNGTGVEKKYDLEYFEPSVNSKPLPDQWGYYKYSAGGDKDMNLLQDFGSDNVVEYPFPAGGISTNKIRPLREVYLSPEDYLSDRSADEYGMKNFSLKKITYPTGGYTEYDYEPNKYGAVRGGGLRIKSIRSYPGNGEAPLVKRFVYGVNESGSGFSDFDLDQACFYNLSYVINIQRDAPALGYNEVHVSAVKNYSEVPVGDLNGSMFKIFYPEVTVYEYNGDETQANGKTVTNYLLNSLYETDELSSTSASLKLEYPEVPFRTNYHVRNYASGFIPLISRKRVYTQGNQLLEDEVYTYTNNNTPVRSYEGLKVFRKMYVNNHETLVDEDLYGKPRNAYNYISSFFDYMYYTVAISGKELLTSKSTSVYQNGSNPVTTTESYTYNDRQQISSISYSNSLQDKLVKQYRYPQNYTDEISRLMVSRNMLNNVVEQISMQNNVETGRLKTNYTNNGSSTNGLLLPSSEQSTMKGVQRTEITYDKYDIKGNILQYTRLDGVKVAYVWGYHYQYPIAEIVNASYDDLPSSIGSIASKAEPSASDWSELANLRSTLPKAQVTIYKYKPLVGISSVTDPTGLTTYYTYDSFNRLQKISIQEPGGIEQTVETYEYHYKNN